MAADASYLDSAGRPLLDRHRLSEQDFDALAAGIEDDNVVKTLRATEHSQRLVLLRVLLDEVRRQPAAVGPLPPVDEAWDLLVRAERSDATEAAKVVDYPLTGIWAAFTLRRLRGLHHDDAPLWVDVGYVHAIAAAAALRAGITFRTVIPVRRGTTTVPTVGCVRLPSRDPWETAELVAGRDGVRCVGRHGEVRIPPADTASSETWASLATLRPSHHELELSITLEDESPYRYVVHPAMPAPLTEREVRRWRSLFDDAWALLVREYPSHAHALAASIRVAVPTPRAERFRPRSASSGDGFGSMLLSESDDAVQLAATMVHELQHAKLGALMHLVDLHEGDCPDRFYAPWRDDPRPLGGLLQGVFAFLGVTHFWRGQSRVRQASDATLAHFEFALWRHQVKRALDVLRERPELTALGRRFLAGVSTTLDGWLTEPVPHAVRALARRARISHHAQWRLHHLRPSDEAVETLASAWTCSGAANPPPASALHAAVTLRPDPAVSGLEAHAVLTRYLLTDRPTLRALHGSDALGRQIAGATDADVTLLLGDAAGASADYLAVLDDNPRSPGAWSGLGLAADAMGDRDAARALAERPELVREVYQAVAATAPRRRPPDRLDLARWVGSAAEDEARPVRW